MKISVLMENTVSDARYRAEHGLSLLVGTDRHRILFDTGASGDFADNARMMGVDLESVDIAVISHGHYDHGGGLKRFLSENRHATVYLSEYAFDEYYNAENAQIGLDARLINHPRVVCVRQTRMLDDELELIVPDGCARTTPLNSYGLQMKRDGALAPDDFRHEIYLVIHEKDKRVLLSGCSHRGVLDIVEWIRPQVMIGGFHFMKLDPTGADHAVLDDAAQALLRYDCTYYTCHCTGLAPYDYLKARMGDRLHYCSCGQVLTL